MVEGLEPQPVELLPFEGAGGGGAGREMYSPTGGSSLGGCWFVGASCAEAPFIQAGVVRPLPRPADPEPGSEEGGGGAGVDDFEPQPALELLAGGLPQPPPPPPVAAAALLLAPQPAPLPPPPADARAAADDELPPTGLPPKPPLPDGSGVEAGGDDFEPQPALELLAGGLPQPPPPPPVAAAALLLAPQPAPLPPPPADAEATPADVLLETLAKKELASEIPAAVSSLTDARVDAFVAQPPEVELGEDLPQPPPPPAAAGAEALALLPQPAAAGAGTDEELLPQLMLLGAEACGGELLPESFRLLKLENA